MSSVPRPLHHADPRCRPGAPALTVIVKAWNEERHIEACLRSVLREIAQLHGEVILADSVSTDRTVEIARQFDVQIVQLACPGDRSCGAALQLGYQFSRGRYIYVLDADMTLAPGFLHRAIDYLDAHPGVAGVGGRIIDLQLNNAADKKRAALFAALRQEQVVASLGGGGMYRRSAIEAVGYLAHRWLPACEEAELGARLASAGWSLVRLADAAVMHCGHDETSLQMLRRLWRNGRMHAYGMFLRSALGRPWLGAAVKSCWFVFIAPALCLAALAIAAFGAGRGLDFVLAWSAAQLAIWSAVIAALVWRKRNLAEALLAFLAWHWFAIAAAGGMFRPVRDPLISIQARIVKSA